jgi:hypothetical protein
MDPGSVMFIMVFLVPITAIIVKSPLGKALADRIAGRTGGDDPRLLAELDAMRGELDQVHEQLAEMHERLDFSERLLAKHRESIDTPPEGVTP